MGKHGRRYRGSVPCARLLEAINTLPVKELYPAAKVVCGTDYAVRFYKNKKHPKFYHNEEAFRKALRRCVANPAFDHVAILIRMLDLDNSCIDK